MARTAYQYALSLLSSRGYTIRNLRRKLVQKAFDADEIEQVIARLVDARYVDDQQYALEYARQKLVSGGSSVRRVEQDLARRGVNADEIRVAVESVMEDGDVDISRSIERAARKKLASMSDLDIDVRRRRLFGFLARAGFEASDVRRVVAETLPRGNH